MLRQEKNLRSAQAGTARRRTNAHGSKTDDHATFPQKQLAFFSTNSFVFDLDVQNAIYALTWLCVEKEVNGRRAVQLERLVNELTSSVPSTYLQVQRDGPQGRFFPIKTPADLTASRAQLREMLAVSVLGQA